MGKSEIRSSKSESNPKKKIRNPKYAFDIRFGVWDLLRISGFGFRIYAAEIFEGTSGSNLPEPHANQKRKKKPSAVAGKVSLLFRGLSWSQGRYSESVTRGDNQRAGRETSGATWPGRSHEELLLLLRGLLGRLLSGFLLCHSVLPPFLIAECKAEKILRQ